MRKTGIGVTTNTLDYDSFWRYSIEFPDEFWKSVWEYCGVIGEFGDTTMEHADDIREVKFFPNARLNYAENLLRRRDNDTALIFHAENGRVTRTSFSDLGRMVSRLQKALMSEGIVAGDRVAGIVPNTPNAIAAMLAVTSLGAVWSSCSPDFGPIGILDRFRQIEPKLIFCSDGYAYAGKWFDTLDQATKVADDMPSVRRLVVLPYMDEPPELQLDDAKTVSLSRYIRNFESGGIDFARVGFDSPLFIMFSSGTTGLPKCIVHSVGGTLVQHLKEHQLQCDIQPGDRLMYFTTCGWMMWNWMVSALASKASLVLYDGSPVHPEPGRLVDAIRRESVTHFGASAKYFETCAKHGVKPSGSGPLPSLKSIFSTGSPLSPESFDYVYANWKKDVCLSSIAGGTDIIGCFVGGSPISPVYRGQCQKRYLGLDVRVFDEDGNSISGRAGELVCASAHPSIPTGFLNDPNGAKFTEAYFTKFPGVWHHGDWVEITKEGGIIFYGRSDATLNPGGVRIGTAEIYRPVERVDEVLESLVIGRRKGSDVELVLFVKLREGVELTDSLVAAIKGRIRKEASPRHVPAKVISVSDIPRTKSGKIVELAVRNVVNGDTVENVHALANPEALELFKDLAELRN